MAINFPSSPANNDIYSYGSQSWRWDGTSWNSLGYVPVGKAGATQDEFTGTGACTTFTLSTTAVNEASTIVFVDGVIQSNSAYNVTANSNQIVFSAAPRNGGKIIAYTITAGPTGPSGPVGATGPVAGVGTGNPGSVLNSFTGDGSTKTFYLNLTPTNEDHTIVFVDRVYQRSSAYNVSSNTVVFTDAPPNGSAIDVYTHGDAGPQGPQGPQGPSGPSGGPTGPEGPQGPTPTVYYSKTYNIIGPIPIYTGTARFYPPSNVTLTSAYFTVSDAPLTGNATVSIIKNSSATLNTLNITAGSYVSANYAMSSTMLKTDFLTISTTAGSGAANGALTIIYTITS